MSCLGFYKNSSLLLPLLLFLNENQFNLVYCNFLEYLMKRMMMACICLERFNFTNLHLPFFVRFLGVIACSTKSDRSSPSSLSLPLSVTKCCCRFCLNILPVSFWWFGLSLYWTCNKKLYVFQALQTTRYRTNNWTTIPWEIHWHNWKNWQANDYFAKKVHSTLLKNLK